MTDHPQDARRLAAAPPGPGRRDGSDRSRRGGQGRRLRGPAGRPSRLGPGRRRRRDPGGRPARPGRCRLPDRRQVAARRGHAGRPALRGGQRLRRRPGGADRRAAPRARSVQRDRGRRRSPPGRSAPTPRSSPSGRPRPRRSGASRRPSERPRRPASSARTCSTPDASWRSRFGRSRAPTCSARRRSCSRPSRASVASPSSDRRIPPSAACSAGRPSSRTSRPWPWPPGSCARAPPHSGRSAAPTPRARSWSTSAARAARASPRCPWGPRSATILGLVGASHPAGPAPKALLVGGPSGGILPADLLDTPYSLRRAAGGRRPRRLGLDRGHRRPRRTSSSWPSCSPGSAPAEACGKTIPCRIGTRRLEEIADPDQRRHAAADRRRPADRPVGRHRGQRPVRPRAAGDTSTDQRDAILPTRAGCEAPARGGAKPRRTEALAPMTDLIARPAPAARADAVRAPAHDPGAAAAAVDAGDPGRGRRPGGRGPRRARRSWRSAATTGSRSRPCATSPSCPASVPAGCAWSRSRARSIRRSPARGRPSRA